MFGHVSDRFSDVFARLSNHFSYRIKTCSATISFGRRASLRVSTASCGTVLRFAALRTLICTFSVYNAIGSDTR